MVHTQKYFGSKENNRRLADLLRLSGFERFKDRLPTFRSKDGVKVIVEPKGKDIAKEKGSFVLEHNQPLEEYPEDHPMFLFLNSVNSPKELSGENFIQEPIDYIKSNQSLSGYSFNPPRMQQLRSPSFVLLLLNFIFNPTEGWNKIRDYFTIQPLDVTENCCIPFPYVGRQPLQHFEQDGRHSLREYLERGRNAGLIDLDLELEEIVEEPDLMFEDVLTPSYAGNGFGKSTSEADSEVLGRSFLYAFTPKEVEETFNPSSFGDVAKSGENLFGDINRRGDGTSAPGRGIDFGKSTTSNYESLTKKMRKPRKKLEDDLVGTSNFYIEGLEGIFDPVAMRRFFTTTLDSRLAGISSGSWKKGGWTTPTDVYTVQTENGTAVFVYKANVGSRGRKGTLESFGNEEAIEEVYRLLEKEHLGILGNQSEPVLRIDYYKNISEKVLRLRDHNVKGTEVYNAVSEGAYTPVQIREFFEKDLEAQLVVDGSWKRSRKTPLNIYVVQNEKGVATFTYKAEDYSRSKWSLLEAHGDDAVISDVYKSLEERNDKLLGRTPVYGPEALVVELDKEMVLAGVA